MPGPRAAGAPLDGALGAGRDFHRWNVRWNEFSTASARRRESPSLLPQAEAPKKNFVRGEWVVGRGLGLLRGPSSGWCVRCSPGRESLENGGPADSRRQWLGPLTTDGQPRSTKRCSTLPSSPAEELPLPLASSSRKVLSGIAVRGTTRGYSRRSRPDPPTCACGCHGRA